jgi:hypothetical protein
MTSIGWAAGSRRRAPSPRTRTTLAKTYQLNEKLTWLKGRHTLKFGGQFLRYDQQRFYAGNNGLLGFINFNGAFTGNAFSDFLLDKVSSKGRGGGDPNDPWTPPAEPIGLFVQDDFKVKPNLTLNLGLRWAYTSPLVEKDNRSRTSTWRCRSAAGPACRPCEGRQHLRPRALQLLLQGLRAAGRRRLERERPLVFRGGYGISQYMEGTGANLRLPLNPPFFFESNVNYDATTGAGRWRAASPTSCPARRRPATCARTT